jgi:AraC-like DNA-binding protein
MAFTSISSISLAIIGREKFLNHDYYLILPSLIFSLMLFIIGYLGNRQRQIFSEKRALKMVSTYTVDDAIPERLKEELITLFRNKKVYLQKDLKIWDISGLLATNRTYISRIINQDFDKNFCSFVNDYRIEHAKKLLAENNNYSNEEIAELSGFGSINSFYRVFKQKENISIGKYRDDNLE